MPHWPNFVGQDYQPQSALIAARRVVNLYPSAFEVPGLPIQQGYLPTPGLMNLLVLAKAPTRGAISVLGNTWVVAKDQLYDVNAAFVATARGAAIAVDTSPCTFATSGDAGAQMLFSSGGKAYWVNLATKAVADTALAGTYTHVDFLDTFGLALDVASSTLHASKSLDFATWPGTAIYQRSSVGDRLRALKVVRNNVFLFGDFTTDVLYNAGLSPMPIVLRQGSGANIRHGIAAAFSAQEFRGSVVWLAQNKSGGRYILRAGGVGEPDKISTDALDYQLRKYATVSDAEAFVDIQDGEDAYILSFPTANITWVFTEKGGWHERGTFNQDFGRYDAWRPRWQTFNYGKTIAGDRTTGTIYTITPESSVDADGAAIRRFLQPGSLIAPDRQRFTLDNLELVIDCDPRIDQGLGNNPTVSLQMSRNAGRTFGTERWRKVGAKGVYERRVRWTMFGSARTFTPRFVIAEPVPARILDLLFNQDEAAA